jgi:hypothetical protein
MRHYGAVGDSEIVSELYRTLVLLRADNELLGAVGSWKNGLPNQDVLAALKAWNTASVAELKVCIAHYEISCPHSDCSRVEVQGNTVGGS